MKVKEAKQIAEQWVLEERVKTPGFAGAYFAGSITEFPDDVDLPTSSDVDIKIILNQPNEELQPIKFLHHGVILEVSYTLEEQIGSPEQLLGDFRRAGGFKGANIISDPSSNLQRLQEAVTKDFAKREWVYRRCEDAKNNTLGFLQAVNKVELFHDQVTCWLFGTAGTTHILLVAGLKNPTVRRRYMTARNLLAEYGRLGFYETIQELQGSALMTRERAEYHLDAVTEVFNFAKEIIKTPYRFASDISDIGRPISIGGSRELIESGFHREAVYWLVATYSRCMAILHNDASQETQDDFMKGYWELLNDLGVYSFADLQARSKQVEEYLPDVWEVAESIIEANPEIWD